MLGEALRPPLFFSGETILKSWVNLLAVLPHGRTFSTRPRTVASRMRPSAEISRRFLILPQHGWTQGMLFSDLSSPFGRGRGGPGGWWRRDSSTARLRLSHSFAPELLVVRPPVRRMRDSAGSSSRRNDGVWASTRRSSSSSSPAATMTATARPFLVTTIGPRSHSST